MITLAEAKENVGRWVVYVPEGARPELGVITEAREVYGCSGYVFVRYRGDLHAKATAPEMLDWTISPEVA